MLINGNVATVVENHINNLVLMAFFCQDKVRVLFLVAAAVFQRRRNAKRTCIIFWVQVKEIQVVKMNPKPFTTAPLITHGKVLLVQLHL